MRRDAKIASRLYTGSANAKKSNGHSNNGNISNNNGGTPSYYHSRPHQAKKTTYVDNVNNNAQQYRNNHHAHQQYHNHHQSNIANNGVTKKNSATSGASAATAITICLDKKEQLLKQMNISALRNIDPSVDDIIYSTKQVVVYSFDTETQSWTKKDIEGPLFIVSRKASSASNNIGNEDHQAAPATSDETNYGLIVMNRRNTENLIEFMRNDGTFEVQVECPYVMYRNLNDASNEEINGIWFYDSVECLHVGNLLFRLLQSNQQEEQAPAAALLEENNVGYQYYSSDPGPAQGIPAATTTAVCGEDPSVGGSWNNSSNNNDIGKQIMAMLQQGSAPEQNAAAAHTSSLSQPIFVGSPTTTTTSAATAPARNSAVSTQTITNELRALFGLPLGGESQPANDNNNISTSSASSAKPVLAASTGNNSNVVAAENAHWKLLPPTAFFSMMNEGPDPAYYER
eukprot:GEZU01018127.1.p1 GENE.GEZU01018127.1~~GEZU01018127.1.p1  ORF type:complete len:457 (+),score=106.66 GEZU01018127.1:103-1473(+)